MSLSFALADALVDKARRQQDDAMSEVHAQGLGLFFKFLPLLLEEIVPPASPPLSLIVDLLETLGTPTDLLRSDLLRDNFLGSGTGQIPSQVLTFAPPFFKAAKSTVYHNHYHNYDHDYN